VPDEIELRLLLQLEEIPWPYASKNKRTFEITQNSIESLFYLYNIIEELNPSSRSQVYTLLIHASIHTHSLTTQTHREQRVTSVAATAKRPSTIDIETIRKDTTEKRGSCKKEDHQD